MRAIEIDKMNREPRLIFTAEADEELMHAACPNYGPELL